MHLPNFNTVKVMNKPTDPKQRYTQFFVVIILCSTMLITFQCLSGGFTDLSTSLPGRAPLITLFTRIRIKLGDRVINGGVIGKDGWMEYADLDDYQNSLNQPEDNAKKIQEKLKTLYNALQAQNIMLVLVVAPNKATIYPDKLPDELHKIEAKSQLDLIIETLQQQGPQVLIDLRPALDKARQRNIIYYKTDTHWNSYGAYAAYAEIMKKISQTYPALAPKKMNQFQINITGTNVLDIARVISATYIKEPSLTIRPIKNNLRWVIYNTSDPSPISISYSTSDNSNMPRLLMYVDSFGVRLKPLISPHFSQATFNNTQTLSPDALSFKQIEVTKPDIVIIEIVERNLNQLAGLLTKLEIDSTLPNQ